MLKTTVYLDVSLLLRMSTRTPVGLSRVLTEVARSLAEHDQFRITFVRDGQSDGSGFYRLGAEELEVLSIRSDWIGRCARELIEDLATNRKFNPQKSSVMYRLLAAIRCQSVAYRQRLRSSQSQKVVGEAGAVLVCATNPWDYVTLDGLSAFQALGAHVVTVVHDLMVWETPHMTAGRDARQYVSEMVAILKRSCELVAVSNHTANVLSAALREENGPAPPITVAHPSPEVNATGDLIAPPTGFDPSRRFVLICSTIEIRKNHVLLLQIWEKLRLDLDANKLPCLVFAGTWGWGVEPVRLMIERNWRLAPYLRVLENVDDGALAWLFSHAAFTVFPSFNEGFGLPAAESLSFGTPVLVSKIPALIEASEGLMPSLDPGDMPGWFSEIRRLCVDDAYLQSLREKARTYRGPARNGIGAAVVAAVKRAGSGSKEKSPFAR